LVTAFKKKPKEVTDWLDDDSQEITRGTVKLLREFLDEKRRSEQLDDEGPDDGGQESQDDAQGVNDAKKKDETPDDPEKMKKTIVQVKHNGRPARLILNRRPRAEGYAWLKYTDDGQEFEADLDKVRLVSLVEG
jgi:ParB family chromosome partitioning protein